MPQGKYYSYRLPVISTWTLVTASIFSTALCFPEVPDFHLDWNFVELVYMLHSYESVLALWLEVLSSCLKSGLYNGLAYVLQIYILGGLLILQGTYI